METQIEVMSHLRVEESIETCLEILTTALLTIPTQIIECTSISTGNSAVAMLD